jgi:uncharacterized protein (TIGR01319 family)
VDVAVLADFGSTFTKVALVEEASGTLLATAEVPTTLGSDLMEGYAEAVAAARARAPRGINITAELAASSAGGGLRVIAVGLVRDLTAAAASRAALNAGARVSRVLAGRIGPAERESLELERPEIVLFAGGTDGGQRDLVLENAQSLAGCEIDASIVVACNCDVAEQVAETLVDAGHRAEVAPNVMPRLGELRVEGARAAILRAFVTHVIRGKALSASPQFGRLVKMPTPDAVLRATALLARGSSPGDGIGSLMVIDIGGATTDVHSDRVRETTAPGIEQPLLPPPSTLRTVEGDLGLRAGARGVLKADGDWLAERAGDGDGRRLRRAAERREREPAWVPKDGAEQRMDRLLATGCATHALNRHCGRLLLRKHRLGAPRLAYTGPDLREVRLLVGTGGVLTHNEGSAEVIREGLARRAAHSLSPRDPVVRIDRSYVLAAAGLFSTRSREAASKLLRAELTHD